MSLLWLLKHDQFDILQTGMIKLLSETFFVHLLPDHLAKHVTTGSGARPHLVYRKSAEPLHCKTRSGRDKIGAAVHVKLIICERRN